MMKADILYEQYRLDELSAKQKNELEKDPRLAEKIKELEESDREILARYPAAEMMASIKERQHQAKVIDFRKAAIRFGAPLAAIAALFTVLFLSVPEIFKSDSRADYQYLTGNEDTRIKGAGRPEQLDIPLMHIYRNAGGEAIELNNNDKASAGDRLQLSYFLPEAKYGAIFSLDGNGVLTLHYPDRGTESVELEVGREIYLPFAYELDDAPDYEKFLFIYSDESFSLSEAARAIEEAQGRHADQEIMTILGKNDSIGVYSVNIKKK